MIEESIGTLGGYNALERYRERTVYLVVVIFRADILFSSMKQAIQEDTLQLEVNTNALRSVHSLATSSKTFQLPGSTCLY